MLTENVHTQNDKMVVNMMVQLHAPSMQVLVKQSQLCRNFWVAGHKAGSESVHVCLYSQSHGGAVAREFT